MQREKVEQVALGRCAEGAERGVGGGGESGSATAAKTLRQLGLLDAFSGGSE